jgi:acetyl-CoA synthetase
MDHNDVAWVPDPETIRTANWTAFIAHAGMPSYEALARRADEDPEWYWPKLIEYLGVRFYRPYDRLLDLSDGLPHPKWCVGGTTNLVLNALDAKVDALAQKPAFIWRGEDGAERKWTYAELNAEVCRLAAGLASLGLKPSDVVGIYMPMVPEAIAAFLAIAKLGCVGLPLFSGFGADAVATRLNDGEAKALITVDETLRRGKRIPMKEVADEAAAQVPTLQHIIVVPRFEGVATMQPGRDIWWADLVAGQPPVFPTTEVAAEHPLILIYTSGTTGRPKGIIHTHVGLTVKIGQDTHLGWNLKPDDRLLYIIDMGWFGGPMVISGTLLSDATAVFIEGVPDYPSPDRLWRLIEEYKATFIGVAPTLLRAARSRGASEITKHDLSSLRGVGTSAEPIDPDLWLWMFETICRRRVPITNFSGGTEIGTAVSSNILLPMKPAAFNGGVPGVGADVVNAHGERTAPGEIGELVMRSPCIGRAHQVWRDPKRYLESYWQQIPGVWTVGDAASRDADGYWYLHGRSDDTVKVAGKRTGPAELEAILMRTGAVADAAVVGVPDPIKGSAVVCVVVPAPGEQAGNDLSGRLSSTIVASMGVSFRPTRVLFVQDLPKTRTMKVMRRLIRDVLLGRSVGETSTLANPEALEALRQAAAATAQAPA